MKLLLHACCGPCSLEPVRILAEAGHDITIAYLNSNIAPASEYEHRLQTLLTWAQSQNIPVIEGPYEPKAWQEAVRRAWDGKQENRQDRCRACYRLRLEELARYAHEHGYEGIGTTLTVSPYQYISVIGEELERAAHNCELVSSGKTVLTLDYAMSGVGSNSCGPELPEKYRMNEAAFWMHFVLIPEKK